MIIVDCIKQIKLLIHQTRLIVKQLKELKFKLKPKNLLHIVMLMVLPTLIMNSIKKLEALLQQIKLIIYLEVMEQRFTVQHLIQVLHKQLVLIKKKKKIKNQIQFL